jgi:hypothetical protein
MPLDVVAKHAQQDVGTDAVGLVVMDGANVKVHCLEAAEGTLDDG